MRCGCVFAGLAWLTAVSMTPASAQEAKRPDAARVPVALPEDVLRDVAVEDTRRGLQPEEYHAYYAVLDHARRVDLDRLKAAAKEFEAKRRAQFPRLRAEADFPTFVDLFRNPRDYGGRPVTLQGHVRKSSWSPADENPYGIDVLHEVWLFTEHSQANPAVVVCTSVPEGFPTDSDLIDHVEVTGYFFKKMIYQAEDATRVAPLILAGRLEWHPERAVQVTGPLPAWLYPVVAAVLAGVVALLWRQARRDRTFRNREQTLPERINLDGITPPTFPTGEDTT